MDGWAGSGERRRARQRHAAPRARRLAEDCAARARAVAPGFFRAFVRSAWAHHADNYCAACRVGALVEDFSFLTQEQERDN